MKRIVVPVDGSDGAARAAKFAAELAAATGAELALLHVYDAPAVAQMGLEALDRDELAHAKDYVAKGSFDAARAAIGDSSINITTHSELGHPARGIVDFADSVRRGSDRDGHARSLGGRGTAARQRERARDAPRAVPRHRGALNGSGRFHADRRQGARGRESRTSPYFAVISRD